MLSKEFIIKLLPAWILSNLFLVTIGIGLFSVIFLFSIDIIKKRKKLPPYNPDNMLETIKIFTGTKTPEYVLDCSRSVGSVFMCKFEQVFNFLK